MKCASFKCSTWENIATNMGEEFRTELCTYSNKMSCFGRGLYKIALLFNALPTSSKITAKNSRKIAVKFRTEITT